MCETVTLCELQIPNLGLMLVGYSSRGRTLEKLREIQPKECRAGRCLLSSLYLPVAGLEQVTGDALVSIDLQWVFYKEGAIRVSRNVVS